MKILLFTILISTLSLAGYATGRNSTSNFCEWLGDSATAIAQNRDQGMSEYDLIGRYLSEGKTYAEQSVVIQLIDRVYNIESHISPDNIAIVEQAQCEIALAKYENTIYQRY